MLAIPYIRVSTDIQEVSGLGLEAQEATIREVCARKGWTIDEAHVYRETISSRARVRPEYERAQQAASAVGGVLVVAKGDRLCRSTLQMLLLHAEAATAGWSVYLADMPDIDTTTPTGRLFLTMLSAVAEYERALISQRITEALAAKQARGEHVGRYRETTDEVIDLMRAERAAGRTFAEIAERFNAEGVPAARGGVWSSASVWRAYERRDTPLAPLRLLEGGAA